MMEPLIQADQGEDSAPGDVETAADARGEDSDVGAPAASDDSQDTIAPPPISTLVAGARFWWKFFQWPLLLFVINAIMFWYLAWSAVADIDDMFDNYNNGDDYNGPHDRKKQIGELSVAVFVIAILLLADSVLMFRWASLVQNQLDRLELEEDAESSSSRSNLVYGRVSKMADRFLAGSTSPGRSVRSSLVLPKISLLVNACYVGMSLFLAAGFTAAVVAVYLQKRSALSDCIETSPSKAREQRAGNMTNVPPQLQEWAVSDRHRYYGGQSMEFSHLVDGTTFFAARPPRKFDEEDANRDGILPMGGTIVISDITMPGRHILVETTSTGALVQHKNYTMPRHFIEFGKANGDDDPSANLFCCVITKMAEINSKQGYQMDLNENYIYCYDATQQTRQEVAAVPTQPSSQFRNGNFLNQGIQKARSFQGKLWYVAYWYNRRRNDGARTKVQVYNMDIEDFQVKLVGEADLNTNQHFHRANPCLKRLYLWLDIIASSVLFLSSLVLCKWLKLPGGVVPGVVGAHLVLTNIDTSLSFLLSLLASLFLLVCLSSRNLLPDWLDREMATWTLYTCFVCSLFICDGEPTCITIPVVLFLFSAFILNHPILLVLGYVSGLVFSLGSTFVLLLDGGPGADEIFWVVCISTVFSAGAGSLGHTLVKYRGYLIWCSRRLWRALDTMGTADGQR